MLDYSNLTLALLHHLNTALFMCVFIPLWLYNMSTLLCLCIYELVSGSLWLVFDGKFFLSFFLGFLLACVLSAHYNTVQLKQATFIAFE